jgi:hypothetical protein
MGAPIRKAAVYKPGRKPSQEPNLWHLDLRFSASRTRKNKCLLFELHSLWDFEWQPERHQLLHNIIRLLINLKEILQVKSKTCGGITVNSYFSQLYFINFKYFTL